MRFGIGQPVTRKEDARFLTGRGRYVADIDFVRQAHAALVFSPHAHARIRTVDKAAAEQMPGVHAVLTGEDWAADGLGTLDPEVMAEDMGGPIGYRTKRPPLAQQIPALVQRLLGRPQLRTLLGPGQLAVGGLGAQVVLGRDELVDVAQDLLVVHEANARRPTGPGAHRTGPTVLDAAATA